MWRFNAKSLSKTAFSVNRKSTKKDVFELYKDLKKAIKQRAKKGEFSFSSRELDIEDYYHNKVYWSFRYFRRKNPGFQYKEIRHFKSQPWKVIVKVSWE